MPNYTIPPFEWDSERNLYTIRHRLTSGQFCQMWFMRDDGRNRYAYAVAFAVADKKKHLAGWFDGDSRDRLSYRMTGRSGVEALYWARDTLLLFEKTVIPEDLLRVRGKQELKIFVFAEDGKHWRLYQKALQKYGYKMAQDQNGKAMVKNFSRK